ncbi:MAG: biotin transporter BioY [Defluviitaleaceae bacterium]|nr:biotin transporter BioY [Defluviitaleaceae bacterium]
MESKPRRLSTSELGHIGIFTAVIAVMAQLTIPLPPVPLTMQTFAVPLAGAVLGAKKGSIAAIIYLILGAVGAPVFSGFTGGYSFIIGPSGGYLLSYPLFAFIVGLGSYKNNRIWLALGLVIGSIINLSMGMFQLAFVLQIDMRAAFALGVFPFIVPELIKLSLVFVIAPKIRQAIERNK